jgi:hypothetical protein
MKTPIFILLLIASAFFCKAQNVDWDLVEQHYFETYQPTDTPAWIFPIIAINGDGQQDTIYYCYDPNALTYNFDELHYGEIRYKIDSVDFQFSFLAASLDSFYNVQAFGNPLPENDAYWIYIRNSKYPLTLKWNGSKLYDTILPFPNILPKPIARIGGPWKHYYTPPIFYNGHTFIVASADGYNCPGLYFIDSVLFDGPLSASPDDFLAIALGLQKQDGPCLDIMSVFETTKRQLINYRIDNNVLSIKSVVNNDINIKLFNIMGQLLHHERARINIPLEINLSNYPSGLYLIEANDNINYHNIKFIIQ